MNSSPTAAELERIVGRVIDDLPPRSAPATLELKVLAAIARNAALPWWRLSFLHWPLPARLVFLAASVGFVKLGLLLANAVAATLPATTELAAAAPGASWMRVAVDLTVSLGAAWRVLIASIPALWLYAGGGMILMLYGLFFGIGALGYRALQASR